MKYSPLQCAAAATFFAFCTGCGDSEGGSSSSGANGGASPGGQSDDGGSDGGGDGQGDGGTGGSVLIEGEVPSGSWTPTAEKLAFEAQVIVGNPPSIAVGPDERPVLAVTEEDNANENADLQFWRNDEDGWTPAAPSLNILSDDVSFPNEAQIAFDASGRLVTLFSEGRGACAFNTYARRLAGGSWVALGTEGALKKGNCGEVYLATDGDDVVAAWQSSKATPRHLVVRRYSEKWSDIGAGGEVPNEDPSVMDADLTVSEDGVPMVAWTAIDKADTNLHVAVVEDGKWTTRSKRTTAQFSVELGVLAGAPVTLAAERNDKDEAVLRLRRHLAGDQQPQVGTDLPAEGSFLLEVLPNGVPVVIRSTEAGVDIKGWDGSDWETIGETLSAETCSDVTVSPAGVLWLVCIDEKTFSSDKPASLTVMSLVP